ncbi:hypothetical protein BDQ17DRAFT_1398614 [Cyathus striatus]|nr:hypothetical protein BDQ17DRAFT_1398614 [Cyathus striatus]
MIPAALSSLATFPATALADKHFPWPTGVPYKADTDTNLVRGGQHGYNICNSTTEGQDSLCQTSFVNSIEDFCLWGPPTPNSEVGSTEGEMVAWCTKAGHGTRLIPRGALTGVQWIRTPDYVAVIGYLDQTKVNIAAGDYGGEMDPHGADLRGNPLGGLMYSNAWGSGGEDYDQVIEWHNFIGGDSFCLKACDPAGPNAAHFCEHIYDRIGMFLQRPQQRPKPCDYPGIYTSDGVTMTYKQPAESLGAISTMPYTPRVPQTSNCVTYDSASLYSGLVTLPSNSAVSTTSSSAASSTVTSSGASSSVTSSVGTSSGASSSVSGSTSRSTASGAASTRAPASSSATSSGTAQSAQSSTSDATAMAISGISVLGVVFSALFLS